MTSSSNAASSQGADQDLPPLQILIVQVSAFQQNCSILWDPRTMVGAVVDPGGDVPLLLEAIRENGVKVEKIVITHGHIDHVGGAADLAAELGVPVEGPHEADRMLLKRVSDQARQFGLPDVKTVEPDRWLEDGDTMEMAGRSFDVLHCPGHAPGHVVFFDPELRLAISGDVLFKGSVGRTDLPGGDHATLIRSIRDKLLPLGDDVSFLPGHGPASTLGEERRTNPFLV
ncbi:MBL fold metallo-hydrolase [Roseibium aestuarii]|uniref:MBL fold metallo-hydrolase n=1 Tax=Roseibium aestuarii TaxID=2600299 RepID=A0ABW4JY22_9HYPH|nr:MBL fold metallo-hydrolase [Roseibium aestuarii]